MCKEENPDAVKAVLSRGRGKAKYVQDATCRFADDPERVLSSRGRDEAKSNREFPLYVVASIIETVCVYGLLLFYRHSNFTKKISLMKKERIRL